LFFYFKGCYKEYTPKNIKCNKEQSSQKILTKITMGENSNTKVENKGKGF
jgi:hypothetical protein